MATGRLSDEEVWLAALQAAISGLCQGERASIYTRGENTEQRTHELVGAAALIANRAVVEHSLYYPLEP
jgi:hypothetical protein